MKELMLLNCGVWENSWESLGLQGNQPWIFIGMTDAEAPIVWPPDVKSQLISKDPDAGKDWRQEKKGTTENEMVGCHHWLNGCEFEQALGDGDRHGSLTCCNPWGHKESDTPEWLNSGSSQNYFHQYLVNCHDVQIFQGQMLSNTVYQ